jgi:glycerol-3-phosphate dehydrogenase subunit B
MRNRSLTYDVVVIGGGLSGALAAAAARRQGARVAVLAEGAGMMELSSGCIDLLGWMPDGRPVVHPWEALSDLIAAEPGHPYALVGIDAIGDALAAYHFLCNAMGKTYRIAGNAGNQWLATAAGTLRPTYYAASGMVAPRPGEPLWVVGVRGMNEFHPGVVAEGLRKTLPGTPVQWSWADLPDGGDLHPLQIAARLEDADYRARFVANLLAARPAEFTPALTLLPAVLGINQAKAVRADVRAALGAPISEVPLLSPSVPGLRLSALWSRCLQAQEVDLCLGMHVTEADTAGGRVTAVRGRAPGGQMEYRADAFVLAGGGLLGRGLVEEGRTVREPIFGLPVELPVGQAWAETDLLPGTGGHAFVKAGVRVDQTLRPEGWANLYVCGKMLAGYDPYATGCGGGVAVATGWQAGRLAAGTLVGGAAR